MIGVFGKSLKLLELDFLCFFKFFMPLKPLLPSQSFAELLKSKCWQREIFAHSSFELIDLIISVILICLPFLIIINLAKIE